MRAKQGEILVCVVEGGTLDRVVSSKDDYPLY